MKVNIIITVSNTDIKRKFEYELCDQTPLIRKNYLSFIVNCATYVWSELFGCQRKAEREDLP